jgi:ankyrin repeat protein
MLAGSPEHRALMRANFPDAFDLFMAVFEGTLDDVRARLARGDDPNARSAHGTTPLADAATRPHLLPNADLLLAAGATLDTWDASGNHPLHRAADCFVGETAAVAWLLDHGADLNVAVRPASGLQLHPVGHTPLHIAADRAALPIVMLLLARGADPNRRSADGSTPLHVAARASSAYKRLIRTLVDAGADVNATTPDGRTPLHELADRCPRHAKAAIRFLRSRGARVDLRDAHGRLPVDLVTDLPMADSVRALLTPR